MIGVLIFFQYFGRHIRPVGKRAIDPQNELVLLPMWTGNAHYLYNTKRPIPDMDHTPVTVGELIW